MRQHPRDTGRGALVERWLRAMTAHDLDAAVACYAPDYHDVGARRGEFVHGNEKVRANFD